MSAFHHDARRMTPQRRAKLFAAHGGCCRKCTRKLGPADDWDLDHIIPLACGGKDDDDNLQVLCNWCHDDKTPDDLSRAAKGKRLATRHTVPGRFKKTRGWR